MHGHLHARDAGDDVVIELRVRRANLPARGMELGIHARTGKQIELQLVRRDDGIHELALLTNELVMLSAPDPANAVRMDWGEG